MGVKRSRARAIDGLVLLNKPSGWSSNQVLQKVRWLFDARKAGHTGSLDPAATGVLPICFGEATKFTQFLLDANKAYSATFRLGVETSTADAEGEVLTVKDASAVTASAVEIAADRFRGDILQIPPMVSALKHQGRPLYELARKGIEVERKPRSVSITNLSISAFRPGEIAEVDVHVACSKGTYIRSIAQDLGRALEVGGHVSRLHRTQAGPFSEEVSVSLEDLEKLHSEEGSEALDRYLRPLDVLLQELPRLDIDVNSGHYFSHGQAIMDLRVYRLGGLGDRVRVCTVNGQFLGVGEITDDGRVAPRRLITQAHVPR